MSAPSVQILIPYELSALQRQALYVWLETIGAWVEKRRPFARRNQRHAERVREQRELLQLRLQIWEEEATSPSLVSALESLQQTVRQQLHEYWEVGVTDGSQFDADPITNAVRKYGVDLQAFEPLLWERADASPQELHSLIGALGTVPHHRVEIAGFGEQFEDHVLAAYMAADLAQQYNGWVRLRVQPLFHTHRSEQEWSLADTRALVASINGTTHEVVYGQRRDGSPRVYHLADDIFTKNWAQHPRFWLH